MNKTTLTIEVGASDTLVATVAPAEATDKKVTYTSSDSAVATVSSAGKVTSVKVGTTSVTAKTSNNKTAACAVTVKAKEGA